MECDGMDDTFEYSSVAQPGDWCTEYISHEQFECIKLFAKMDIFLSESMWNLTQLLLGQVLSRNPSFVVAVKSCLILPMFAVVKLVVSCLCTTGSSDWPIDFLGSGHGLKTGEDLLLHFAADLEVNKVWVHMQSKLQLSKGELWWLSCQRAPPIKEPKPKSCWNVDLYPVSGLLTVCFGFPASWTHAQI